MFIFKLVTVFSIHQKTQNSPLTASFMTYSKTKKNSFNLGSWCVKPRNKYSSFGPIKESGFFAVSPVYILRRSFWCLLLLLYLPKRLEVLNMQYATFWFKNLRWLSTLFHRYSLERRWFIHSFRYGCLVTTSPLLLTLPSSPIWHRAFWYCQLSWCDGRWVQDPRTHSPLRGWSTITSDSSFMQASCSLQSELRPGFWDWLPLAGWLPFITGHCSTCVAQGVKGPCWSDVIPAFLPLTCSQSEQTYY